MAREPHGNVTQILTAWGNGDEEALHRLCPLVYKELRRLAHGRMHHERQEHTLQTTGLVHEAFLRLINQGSGSWESRGHFFASAARMMRRVLVDYARRRHGKKRGGGLVRLPLEEATQVVTRPTHDVLAVNEALDALAAFDPRKAKMVELRFFGGLSIEETAETLKVSPGTVMRDWTLAKAWLRRAIQAASPEVSAVSY